ncbi:hypothetical protein [Fluviicola sp.]|uniref:hypothetical protein n=1 Tax=Fluviicola sp. TaxID=1917219 RepID=UPI0031D362BB
MKTVFVILLFFLFSGRVLLAQNAPVYYRTEHKSYFFELSETGCTVYEILKYGGLWETQVLMQEHPLTQPSDSIGVLYRNKVYAVSYDQNRFTLSKVKGNGKISTKKTYVATKMDDPVFVYNALNLDYWGDLYDKTVTQVGLHYPDFNGTYYKYYRRNLPELNFTEAPEVFRPLADEAKLALRDSLMRTNEHCKDLKDSVRNHLHSIDLAKFKSIYVQFPMGSYEYTSYLRETVNLVAEQRPDLFYGLADEMPTEKEHLFSMVSYAKDTKKALKEDQTNIPVKKEYFKYRRITRLKEGLVLTAATIIQVGLVTGLVSLLFI